MKTIGILGGLGPYTTSKLYLDIVNFNKIKNYPNILISNVCFPKGLDEDIISNIKDIDSMVNPLIKSVNQLKKAQVNVFVLLCNTLEDLTSEIKKRTGIKLVTPVMETVKRISGMKLKKLGIIATSKTRELKVYENRLKNIEIIYPSNEDQKEVSLVIGRILTNKIKEGDKKFLEGLVANFKKVGCDKVILGCTDLSNIMGKSSFVMDSFSILSENIKSILLDN